MAVGNDVFGPIPTGSIRVALELSASLPTPAGQAPKIQQLINAPDDPNRFYAVDTRGQVLVIENGVVNNTPLLDLRGRDDFTAPGGEAGLRSIAFHPDFADVNAPGYGLIYTVHSAPVTSRPDGVKVFQQPSIYGPPVFDGVVSEWRLDDQAATPTVDVTTLRELFRIEQPFGNHNVNQLLFNPSVAPEDPNYGMLYIGVGDGGSGDDPADAARDGTSALGKLLRINPLVQIDGSPYGVPADNPFLPENAGPQFDDFLPEIWALGFRNPQTLSFDLERTQSLYIGDIGQDRVEEINIGIAGGDYGWDDREGPLLYDEGAANLLPPNVDDDYQYPITAFDHQEIGNSTAVASGFVYRGEDIQALEGNLLFANFPDGRVFYVPVDTVGPALADGRIAPDEFVAPKELTFELDGAPVTLAQVLGNAGGRVDSRFGTDANGEIYVFGKHTGGIYKLVATAGPVEETIGAVRQIDDLTLSEQTLSFGASLDDAVVFATPATFNGPHPVTSRITSVSDKHVTLQLDEPNYLTDDFHMPEAVTVLALERGLWTLDGGRQLEVGTVTTDLLSSDGFANVTFTQAFDDVPVILTQIQTSNGPDWVVTRVQSVTTTDFEVTMQEEESINGGYHVSEVIGWLAVDAGAFDWSGVGAQAFNTGPIVDSNATTYDLAESVGVNPLIAAGLASYFGPNTANLRLENVDNGTAEIVVHEEQSRDEETFHVAENVAGLAFEGEGLLSATIDLLT